VDDLSLLKLQIEWGADEALDRAPRDRLAPSAPTAAPVPAAPHATLAAPPRSPGAPASSGVAQAEALAAAASTPAELRDALAGFSTCPLQSTAIHLVFSDGNPASGLMVIGDAPGEAEDRTGRPFSGPGGQLLDKMLASIGLDRTTALLTNVIPWRPPGNRNATDHERQLCLPFLRRHIALLRPRRLLLLGTAATASLIPGTTATVRRLRGKFQTITIAGSDYLALPTCSPDQLLATPAGKKDAWADLLTLRQALDQDRENPPDITES
jgi:uracil-DNA glycosylase family 4